MFFKIKKFSSKSKARIGELNLPRGLVKTPVFMPIATQGSVKSVTFLDLENLQNEIILANTYHLWLRPDLEILNTVEGLHNFINWKKPILTDSGGFQAFSLAKIRKFTEEGVIFKSHLNGENRLLTPERSMEIQTVIGSDIALVLDECLPAEIDYQKAKESINLTFRWAKRCQKEFEKLREKKLHKNYLFAIPQGAQFLDLRKESAKMLMDLNFVGYSIGGVANGGEPEEIMYNQVDIQTDILEINKPKHLLGVGTPKDIVQMVARGIDMFDCVLPTRNARHGSLFFWQNGDENYSLERIYNQKFSKDFSPINKDSIFWELRNYSKAYLRHLFVCKELLAFRLATLNNLEFYQQLMLKIRQKIQENTFENWYLTFEALKV